MTTITDEQFNAASRAYLDLRYADKSHDEAMRAALEASEAARGKPHAKLGDGDWFWRELDPDDSGDSVHEALSFVPDFVVCHIGSSYNAASFFAARVPTISQDDDDTEEIIAETEQECIRLVAERKALLDARPPAKGDE
jgi:hypothetical protein